MQAQYAVTAACLFMVVCGAAVAPDDVSTRLNKVSEDEPCAKVSRLYTDGESQVPATLAYDCLQSVPVDVDGDVELVDEIGAYFEWQSNQAYLKNPPPHWGNPKLDLVKELPNMRQKLTDNTYKSEYEFAVELYELPLKSQDNHFSYIPDTLAPFSFQRDIILTSVSLDGLSLPQVYVYSDILPHSHKTSLRNGSHVTHVNGVDVEKYLNSQGPFRDNGQWHDADARYNSLFPNQVSVLSQNNIEPSFTHEYHYVGPSTELTFANGTVANYSNKANFKKDFSGVKDGVSFFKKFCSGKPVEDASSTPPSVTGAPAGDFGYPRPLRAPKGVSAFHLKEDLSDTLILALTTFDLETEETPAYQKAVEEVIAYSVKNGLTKLIIDLRTNNGGNPQVAYALLKQLFPNITPYDTQRFRSTKLLRILGSLAAAVYKDNTTEELVTTELGYYSHKRWVDTDGNAFASAEEMYHETTLNGDKFIAIQRENMSDTNIMNSVNMTGYIYRNSKNEPVSPFAAENIVMLQDGFCSSTCAAFTEMMKTQAHIKTVVLGGRPSYGPMQGIGGVKGGPIFQFTQIHELAKLAYSSILNGTLLTELMHGSFGTLVKGGKPLKRASLDANGKPVSAGLNVADNIRKGDTSGTPLEFVYEAADCRLFYTPEMLLDVKETWKRVGQAQWGAKTNGSSPLCVKGSTGHPSAESREGVPWGVTDVANGTGPSQTSGTGPTATSSSTAKASSGAAIALSTSSVGLLVGLIAALVM